MRKTRILLPGFVVALSLVSSPGGLAQEGGCEASVRATLDTDEEGELKTLQFDVEVSTSESCANIEYDLILDELLPNGQTKSERLPRLVKLNDSGFTEIVRHQIPSSVELSSYEAKIVSCQRCSIMP